MRNHSLESRVREKRTHGSEGGEGERPFLPLSVSAREHRAAGYFNPRTALIVRTTPLSVLPGER